MTERLSLEELRRRYVTVEERVMFILERYPRARSNDTYLIILYWRLFDDIGKYIRFIPFEVIERATKPETIRRTRQYIQNTLGLYPPAPSVACKRRVAEKRMRRIYASGGVLS